MIGHKHLDTVNPDDFSGAYIQNSGGLLVGIFRRKNPLKILRDIPGLGQAEIGLDMARFNLEEVSYIAEKTGNELFKKISLDLQSI